VVAATRVVLRGDQKPEAYVDVGPGGDADVADRLSQRLQHLDGELAGNDPRKPLPGFDQVVRGRGSWDERITRVSGAVRR
jgi:hypothetical protein